MRLGKKQINFLFDGLFVGKSIGRNRGMFTRNAIPYDTLIEVAPVIVMNQKDRQLLDQTLLHDYIFEWGEGRTQCCMALGYIALYNHSYKANCEYEMDFRKQIISVRSIREIKSGEELFINYSGNWNNPTPLWFDAK